ncbi:MAG TPA: 30S ribosomal protein S6 [bacterium]|nr:30S ribosomal protein S6 [bacterium]
MSTYEIVSIVRPDLDEDALNAAIERIQQRISENGGVVKSTDRWGKRRLAYPIGNHRDGFYVMTVFTMDSGRVAPLRQILGLHEALLRFSVGTHRAPAASASTTAPAQTPATAAAPDAPPPPATPAAAPSTEEQPTGPSSGGGSNV